MTQNSVELKQVELLWRAQKWEDHSLTLTKAFNKTLHDSHRRQVRKKTSGSNSLKGSFVINQSDLSLKRLSQITASSLQKHSGAEVN